MYLDLDDDIIDPQFGGDMCVLTSQFLYMHCSVGSQAAATSQSKKGARYNITLIYPL